MAPAGNLPNLPELVDEGIVISHAFHGANASDAQSILANGFRWSRGSKHWLGDGVYFFEDQYEEAMAWANDPKCTNPPPAVLKCSVRLGKCLNFYRTLYSEAYGKLETFLHAQNKPASPAAIINALACRLKADSVRAPYRGKRIKPGKEFVYPFETEIRMILCVRSTANILSREIVYPTAT